MKKLSNQDYAQLIKRIRPYVDFDWNLNEVKRLGLTPADKRTITTYYKEIKKLKQRPHQVYRPRDEKRLAKAQKYAQHGKKLSGLKVAFVPTDGSKAKISFTKNNKIKVKLGSNVNQEFVELDAKKLALNAIDHVNDRIQKFDNKVRFKVNAGEFEIKSAKPKSLIAEYVQALVEQYGTDKAKADGHFYGDWLNGLKAITFENQADFTEYSKKLNEARKNKRKKKRK